MTHGYAPDSTVRADVEMKVHSNVPSPGRPDAAAARNEWRRRQTWLIANPAPWPAARLNPRTRRSSTQSRAAGPSPGNGLHASSRVMVDKITTVGGKRFGERIARLDGAAMVRLNRAILVFLGLA